MQQIDYIRADSIVDYTRKMNEQFYLLRDRPFTVTHLPVVVTQIKTLRGQEDAWTFMGFVQYEVNS